MVSLWFCISWMSAYEYSSNHTLGHSCCFDILDANNITHVSTTIVVVIPNIVATAMITCTVLDRHTHPVPAGPRFPLAAPSELFLIQCSYGDFYPMRIVMSLNLRVGVSCDCCCGYIGEICCLSHVYSANIVRTILLSCNADVFSIGKPLNLLQTINAIV